MLYMLYVPYPSPSFSKYQFMVNRVFSNPSPTPNPTDSLDYLKQIPGMISLVNVFVFMLNLFCIYFIFNSWYNICSW